jgi:hypothetical protein
MRTIDFLLLIPGSLTTGIFLFLFLRERERFRMQFNAIQKMKRLHNQQMQFKSIEIASLQKENTDLLKLKMQFLNTGTANRNT